jgi:signal transduction histidine kinase/DNA-binding response OmpR family regulator
VGKPLDSIIGHTHWDVFPRDEAEKRWKFLSRAISTGTEQVTEVRVPRPDGDTYWVTTATPIKDSSGAISLVVCSSKNITARKRSEEALKESNFQLEATLAHARDLAVQAQEATLAKSRFLASMSHEIRTPLNAILGFSQLMEKDLDASPRQRRHLETIRRSGEHLLALLNDVLELSKGEAGRQVLDPTTFDLQAMLGDLTTMFRNTADAKGLALEAEGIEGLPRFISADALKLRQSLINLLGNAVKFTMTGGVKLRVWIEDAEATEQEPTGQKRFVAVVEDSGPGISAEDELRLFSPFVQAETGRRVSGGTGLGLALSRQFARMMGGDVSVASEPGKGAAFRLEVLVAPGVAPTAAAHEREVLRLEESQPPCQVLVAEDSEASRLFLVEMLEIAGFQVTAVDDGSKAVAACAARLPDLVLIDWQMPGMNGDEAIIQLRQIPKGDQVKIIMLTAQATAEIRSRALAAGADDFMAKPFRQGDLFEKIRVLTDVRYVYSQPLPTQGALANPPVLTRQMLAHLSPELKAGLHEAAIRARQDQLLKLSSQAALVDPEAGEIVRSLVVAYDYDTLIRLLDRQASP